MADACILSDEEREIWVRAAIASLQFGRTPRVAAVNADEFMAEYIHRKEVGRKAREKAEQKSWRL